MHRLACWRGMALILTLGLGACDDGAVALAVPPAPGVVALVDTARIEASALHAFVEGIPPGVRSRKPPAAARQEYLRSLMASYLLAAEARARGLDTTASARTRVARRWRWRVIDAYRRKLAARPVEVSQDEIRHYFVEQELAREREMWAIVVDDSLETARLRAQIQKGADFQALARAHSTHKPTAKAGGRVGFLSLPQARNLGVKAEVFRNLPRGEVSPVLPLGQGALLVRFGPERQRTLDERRAQIQALLEERLRQQRQQEHVDSLATALQWRLDPTGLQWLLDVAGSTPHLNPGNLPQGGQSHALFRYQGGQVDVAAYIGYLWRQPLQALSGWGLQDSAAVVTAAGGLRDEVLTVEAARRAGILDSEEMADWIASAEREVAIDELRRRGALAKAEIDADDVRRYYDDHPELFREPPVYYIVEILVDTRERAETLRDQIEAGASLSDFARQYTQRPGGREGLGVMHLGEPERATHPRLWAAVAAAEPGQLVGPVEVEGGFSLFQVAESAPPPLMSFEKARGRARLLAKRNAQEGRFDVLVDSLLEAYGKRIQVFPGELEAALPDTMMQRLARQEKQG